MAEKHFGAVCSKGATKCNDWLREGNGWVLYKSPNECFNEAQKGVRGFVGRKIAAIAAKEGTFSGSGSKRTGDISTGSF